MKIFDTKKGYWEESINFVDSKNVFVGYSLAQDCCESAGWFLSYTEDTDLPGNHESFLKQAIVKALPELKDLAEDYHFDTSYFQEIKNEKEFDDGGMVRFKLVAENKQPMYLHLYNSHNGYYSHGFESKVGEEQWKTGSI